MTATRIPAPAAPAYRLSTRRYCPTCGGKAQDPQVDLATSLVVAELLEDGSAVLEPGYDTVEPCDEPYHDVTDADYRED